MLAVRGRTLDPYFLFVLPLSGYLEGPAGDDERRAAPDARPFPQELLLARHQVL